MNQYVVDTNCWHPRHHWLPFAPSIEGNEQTKLRACIQQIFILRVFANNVDGTPLRQVADDGSPCRTVVTSHKEIWLQVVEAMTINRHITSSCIVTRRFDARDM